MKKKKMFLIPSEYQFYSSDNGNVVRSQKETYLPIPSVGTDQFFVEFFESSNQSGHDLREMKSISSDQVVSAPPTWVESHDSWRPHNFGSEESGVKYHEIAQQPVVSERDADRFFRSGGSLYMFTSTSQAKVLETDRVTEVAGHKGVYFHAVGISGYSWNCNGGRSSWSVRRFIELLGPDDPDGGGTGGGLPQKLPIEQWAPEMFLEVVKSNRDAIENLARLEFYDFKGFTMLQTLYHTVGYEKWESFSKYIPKNHEVRGIFEKKILAHGWPVVQSQLRRRKKLSQIEGALFVAEKSTVKIVPLRSVFFAFATAKQARVV